MKIMIISNISGINAESFVIKVFDAIKCAAATNNTLTIRVSREQLQELAEHVKKVNWIEINEEMGEKDDK